MQMPLKRAPSIQSDFSADLSGGSDGRRSRDLTIFSRALYQLSYRAVWPTKTAPPEEGAASHSATLTGLEPATSAVTGRHANQLRYRAMLLNCGGDAVFVTPT